MRGCGHVLTFFVAVVCLSPACGGNGDQGDAVVPDAVADADQGEVAETCPAGLVPWPGGGCAPRVDECPNPWELPVLSTAEGPLIGGGCLPIGPRACPKTWDPEAEVDCEAGTLMEYDGNACPEGFVLTDDEVACIPFFEENCGEMEIPVLGGGCKKVGVTEEELGLVEPVFDHCSAGELALPGGGCVQVGPRACPKLWDPESDVDCEVGDVLPCPEGWSESDDGLWCEPIYDECPAGERPLLGGGCQRVVPLAADCPAAPFADVPKSDGQVVYVDALSPCTEGCGAQAAPFSKIGAAVAAVAAGGYVLVQPGAYAEGIVIDKPVHLLGACAATVALSGEVPVPGQEGEAAGIVVKDTSDVAIAGISVQSKDSGLVIAGSKKVSLSGMDVSGAAKVGVRVNGSEVEATGLWIHDTGTPDSPKGEGRGIDVTGKSTVSFTEVVVDKATDAGVAAAGAVLKLSDCVVRDTRWGEPGDRGIGIRVDAGCAGEMRGVVLERNRTIGLRISGPSSTVQVEGCLVRETLVDSEGVSSSGVQVSGGGEATLVKTVMAENAGDGFLMAEEGTSVMLDSCIVRDGKAEVSGFYGRGIEVMGAGELELVGGLVSGNLNYGLLASGAGTNVRILGSVLADTHANPGEPAVAIGVSVWFGAEVQVSLSVVEENGTGNLAALDPGSQLDVCQVSARNGLAFVDPEGLRGAGIDVSGEGSATVSDSLLENNQGMGVWVHDDGSSVLLDGSVVRGTLAAVAEGTGFGLSASGGAGAHVVASLLVGNSNAGVLATEAGTELVVESSTVRDTVPAVAEGVGRGLELNKGAKVSLSSSLVEGSTEVGVGVLDGGGDLSVDGCIIRDTLDGPLTKEGRGIDVGSGGKATISDSLVEGSVGTGVNVSQEGTELWLINSVVRGTVQGGLQGWAAGLVGQKESTVHLVDCLVDGNYGVGVLANNSGTEMTLDGICVRNTLLSGPDPEDVGYGILAQDGASAWLSRSVVEGSQDTGVGASDPGTRLEIADTAVRGTVAPEGQPRGIAAQAQSKALMLMERCVLADNGAVGIYSRGKGTSVDMRGSTVTGTMRSKTADKGAAAQASFGSNLLLSRVALVDNGGEGVIVAGASHAELSSTVVRGTKPKEAGEHGMGIALVEASSAFILDSLVEATYTSGVFLTEKSTATLQGSAVMATQAGGVGWGTGKGEQIYGDGIVATGWAELDLVSVLAMGNKRVGVYYDRASGTVTGVLSTGNDFYGLAMEECADMVEWEGKGNFIVGNATALPPDKAAQVTTTTGGMAVPPAPAMVCIPPDCKE